MKNMKKQSNPSLMKQPEEWKTGDEPLTTAQDAYIHTLAQEASEEVDNNLTKAEASKVIDKLQKKTGRQPARQKPKAQRSASPPKGAGASQHEKEPSEEKVVTDASLAATGEFSEP